MNIKEYLKDPCGSLSIPYWKSKIMLTPNKIKIYHENDFSYNSNDFIRIDKYFRLIHTLKNTPNKQADIIDIDLQNDLDEIVQMINLSYVNEDISVSIKDVHKWLNNPTFNNSLWIKIILNQKMIASGIAEYDPNTEEGIIEWIQVLPEYQGKGFGRKIVKELLYRLSKLAKFVTVSGRLGNISNPLKLYQDCGFTGNDIWYICQTKEDK
ncbi:MAG: GNAT family N-acetyltransferase [Acholeplasmataceae bacterium]